MDIGDYVNEFMEEDGDEVESEYEEDDYEEGEFEEEEEEEEEEYDWDEEEEEETVIEPLPPPPPPLSFLEPPPLPPLPRGWNNGGARNEDVETRTEEVLNGGDSIMFSGNESGDCGSGSEWSRSEIDGLFCSICMDAWTNDGDHYVCCLPCGHIYGFSCINKWLRRSYTSKKCPQCNQKCSPTDIRKLFASRVVAIDDESRKRIQSLEAQCACLEKMGADLYRRETKWRKREAELCLKIRQLEEANKDPSDRLDALQQAVAVSETKLENLATNVEEFNAQLQKKIADSLDRLEKGLQKVDKGLAAILDILSRSHLPSPSS